MDIQVTGRRCQITDEFREHVTEKLSGVEKFRDRIQRIEVQVTAGASKEKPLSCECDITLIQKGPVVRATAVNEDKTIAFDLAFDKLRNQLRKGAERRKDKHRGLRTTGLAEEFLAEFPPPAAEPEPEPTKRTLAGDVEVEGDGPLVLREKTFPGTPLTLAQALDEMELVGHDFFLYVDAQTGRPSVVYRRSKGYSYGVIHLDVA